MKNIFIALSTIAIFLSSHSFASQPPCPTVEKIRTTVFTKAFFGPTEWIAITNIMDTNEVEWTVSADFIYKTLEPEQDALNYLNQQMQIRPLTDPEVEEDKGTTICNYAKGHEFELIAISPAIHPSLIKHFTVHAK